MIPGKKFFYALQVFIILLLILFLAGCSEKKVQPKMDFARPVQSGTAISQSVANYIESFGYLNAINNVDIKSQVTGKIEKCLFDEGQYVKKGDLLFVIDSRVYKAKVDQLNAQLKSDLADVKNKQFIVERDKTLVKRKIINTCRA